MVKLNRDNLLVTGSYNDLVEFWLNFWVKRRIETDDQIIPQSCSKYQV